MSTQQQPTEAEKDMAAYDEWLDEANPEEMARFYGTADDVHETIVLVDSGTITDAEASTMTHEPNTPEAGDSTMRTYTVTIKHQDEADAHVYQTDATNPAEAVTNTEHTFWIAGYTWIKEGSTFYATDKIGGGIITATAKPTRKK